MVGSGFEEGEWRSSENVEGSKMGREEVNNLV